MPKSIIKIKKNGVEYVSNVDRCAYTIRELTFAALYDVAKLLRAKLRVQAKSIGLKGRRVYTAWQYWVRKRDADLQVGTKAKTWYGADQEKGANKVKNVKSHLRKTKHGEVSVDAFSKRFAMKEYGILINTVEDNLDDVRKIMATYISALDNESKAQAMIGGTDNVTDKQSEKDNSN